MSVYILLITAMNRSESLYVRNIYIAREGEREGKRGREREREELHVS